eukprot:8529124-Alexandrium_andersonii.AAC.1
MQLSILAKLSRAQLGQAWHSSGHHPSSPPAVLAFRLKAACSIPASMSGTCCSGWLGMRWP